MTTTIITGRDLTLTVDAVVYDAQASTVTLVQELNRTTHEVLAGRVKHVTDEDGTLTVEMLSDWGAVGSICEALWTAANTDPNTALRFTFVANGEDFSGTVLPVKPDVSGSGNEPTSVTVELPLDGAVTHTPGI